MAIKPVNGHILIKPLEHKTFLPTEKGTFQEIGVVVDMSEELKSHNKIAFLEYNFTFYKVDAKVEIGDEVYFDSWLSAKYPTGEGDGEFYLVPFKDVRAIKRNEANKVSE